MKYVPAFPVSYSHEDSLCEGMSLLDYFAIHLPEPSKDEIDGVSAYESHPARRRDGGPTYRTRIQIAADLRYKKAEEMMKARQKYLEQ